MAGKLPTGNYLGAFHFRVYIDGVNDPLDGFIRVSPINSKTESVEFKHGMDRVVRKAMGRTNWDPIVLERVYSGSDEFSAWRDRIVQGEDDRRTVKIEYLNNKGETIREYDCYNCYPSEWKLPAMDGDKSSPAVETITLQVEKVMLL